MAKNKGTHGKGESSIPVADQFLLGAESAAQKLKPHISKIVTLAVLAMACLIAYSVFDWWRGKQRAELTDTFYEALRVDNARVLEPDETLKPLDVHGVPLEPLSFSSYKERAEAATQKFDALASGSGDAAAMALLMKGKRLLEQDDFAGALASYQQVIDASPDVELLLTARENLGYALEAQAMASEDASAKQAGLEKAAEAFAAMQNDPEGARRDRALFHQARIKAALGQSEDAVATFKKVLSDHPDSMLKTEVENRLMTLGADS